MASTHKPSSYSSGSEYLQNGILHIWRRRGATCNEDHDHLTDFTVCSSWTEYLLVRVLILMTLPAVAYLGIVWRNHYHYRYGVQVDNSALLEAMKSHVVLGVYSIILLPAIICVMYRMLCLCNLKLVLIAHVALCLPILPVAIICYVNAMSFSMDNPTGTIYLNYSGHSNIGILAILLFAMQFVGGVWMLTNKRDRFAPVHSTLGCTVMVVCMMTAISGYESRRFMFLTGDEVGKMTNFAYATSTNLLELFIVILTINIAVLLGLKSMKGLFAMIYPDSEFW